MRQPASKLLGPALTITATWATRKGLNNAYQRRTGKTPPNAAANDVSIGRIIIWAAITAAVVATVNVLINRTLRAVDEVISERESPANSVAIEADKPG